ncbi:deoxyguanosinetriphosphate triphosphohydrolase [Paremcibacter congregatus]|uniref:Deoxyguanosinetriphosphate triphosphohydrolase-like protein n=1 Tax=Paremcibacter congregatus TaxID=2043170 RepID=A0A2G4YQG6_9PROT|nr:deoxyguanosinetriphosphate triphosphohydrolase [Paremcibacter congregatus]PHZ83696.1 deoxyguanosinetriphosphate triphosphohydrolase [Paremcibacter congregatus]QDE27399.1 deoxyguanosinetriphosphate triphosphohydrolase [Paremcibacter congregatus]
MTSAFTLFEPTSHYAPYACLAAKSRGRLYPETDTKTRSPFQRDRDRIIHSGAFRRLIHKTQVFVHHEGDYYRTRLTHSIEVAQIARSLSMVLGLDNEIAESLALVHDFGHTPFGHAGEEALDAAMTHFKGFDHNAQSLRVVTKLEQRYADFEGLNLTWETLEGLAKHNGPLCSKGEFDDLSINLRTYNDQHDLELHTFASAEAQIAAVADDVAYNNHDIADGLRAGLLQMDKLAELPLIGEIVDEVRGAYGKMDEGRETHEVVRRLINRMVNDILDESRKRLCALQPETVDDIRNASRSVISFSDEMKEFDKRLKSFLMQNMYRHYKVNRMSSKAKRIMTDLFELFHSEPECLPTEWQKPEIWESDQERARHVADFIAGMTDSYAILEHKRLFDTSLFEL